MSLFRRTIAVAAAVTMLVTMAPAVAAADPQADIRSVQSKVDALGRKVSDLAEEYNVARIRLAKAKRESAAVASRIRTQEANVERLRTKVAARSAMAYMGGPTDLATLVSAGSPQDVVDRSTSLELLSEHDKRQMVEFTQASKRLAKERAAATKSLAKQKQITTKIGQTKASIVSTLGQQKRLLNQLKERAEKRAREAAEERAQQRERSQDWERASRDTRTTVKQPANLPSASGKAGKVIAFAQAQLGKPYQWGADGPSSYDCSGLTMAAWRKAGVSLPHSSKMQYNSGPHVPRSHLQPGDLVFFYQPISHVALYVGGGKMITAPSSGDVVKYASINSSYYRSNYTGAVRPG